MKNPFRHAPFGLCVAFGIWCAGLSSGHPAREAGSVIGTEPPLAKRNINGVSTSEFVVFPSDCNANPPMLFGGKILAEMDRIAGITTRRALYESPTGARDAVTIAINSVKFHRSGKVKDLCRVTGTVTNVGEKSLTVAVRVERETMGRDGVEFELLAEGEFVFVSVTIDGEKRKPIPHGLAK